MEALVAAATMVMEPDQSVEPMMARAALAFQEGVLDAVATLVIEPDQAAALVVAV